jgi:uncharacterized protein YkwD
MRVGVARPGSVLVLLIGLVGTLAAESPTQAISAGIDDARRDTGAPRLERRRLLDSIALDYARTVAALPHERRLAHGMPIGPLLDEAGVGYRFADLQFQMVRGYDDPGEALLRSWKNHRPGWERALESRYDAIGLATERADDGWVVLVSILVDDPPLPGDLDTLASEVVERVNRLRVERGLAPLDADGRLATVARMHSEDMARRGYLEHVDPEGRTPADRVEAAGIGYRVIGENVVRTQGADDFAEASVRSWLESDGHRANMLGADYTRTGVGVALDGNGTVYVTQLYLDP